MVANPLLLTHCSYIGPGLPLYIHIDFLLLRLTTSVGIWLYRDLVLDILQATGAS